jgi:predicted DNA binding CopG/RHH family protein
MAGKGFGLYDRSITVRVNGEQYERYKKFCLANRIQLNDLVRFLLDKTVAEDDKEFKKVMQRYECLNTLRLAEELYKGIKKK